MFYLQYKVRRITNVDLLVVDRVKCALFALSSSSRLSYGLYMPILTELPYVLAYKVGLCRILANY